MAVSRPDDMRDWNRKKIIDAVRRGGILSRTDISKITGLSAASVSTITSDFIAENVLVRCENTSSSNKLKSVINGDRKSTETRSRGRPQVSLTINGDAAILCSVYFQRNSVSASLIDYSGALIGEHQLQLTQEIKTDTYVKEKIIRCIEEALDKFGVDNLILRRISIGFQGVVDVNRRRVLWTPICPYFDIPLAKWLEEHFDVPTLVNNDCDMMTLALSRQNPEKYGRNFGAVLVAHGVGMGLFLDQDSVNGTNSSGLEFGHIKYIPDGALCSCGKRGCIEAYAGSYAMHRTFRGEKCTSPPASFVSLDDVLALGAEARRGNQRALEAVENAGNAIGMGIAGMFALVDPFPIAIVGSSAHLFDLLEQPIRDSLKQAPGPMRADDVDIDYFIDDGLLVRKGCSIKALLAQDIEMAMRAPTLKTNARAM